MELETTEFVIALPWWLVLSCLLLSAVLIVGVAVLIVWAVADSRKRQHRAERADPQPPDDSRHLESSR